MKRIIKDALIVICASLLATLLLFPVASLFKEKNIEPEITVDFDHWYDGYFYWDNYLQKDLAQKILDMDVIVNYDGIWCHHASERFMVLYNRLEVGDYCKLHDHIYKVIGKTTGYADNGYHFDDGTDVPFGTNCYLTTCQDETGYAIYIMGLEEYDNR